MALSRKLYYYSSGWVDISDYVVSIDPIKYSIDNRVQGISTILKVVLDKNATYGTNKYKLEIGSDYILYAALPDGIENLGEMKIGLTLVDYFLYQLAYKVPKNISGEGEATGWGYGEFTVNTHLDLKAEYSTGGGNFSADNFKSKDEEHYVDPMGNVIVQDVAPRYYSKGCIYHEGGNTYKGNIFVKIKDILDGIITDEGLTIDYDEIIGTEATQSDSGVSLESGTKKVWYARRIGAYIVMMYSIEGYIKLRSYNTSGTLIDTLQVCSTADWKEASQVIHNLAYQFFVDEWNSKIYIPTMRCADYNNGSPPWDFFLRVYKINLDVDSGDLSFNYYDDYSESDVFKRGASYPADWTIFRDRKWRWRKEPARNMMFNAYCDETVGFRLIVGDDHDDKIFVIDPDRHQQSLSNWKYVYSLDHDMNVLPGYDTVDTGIAVDYVNGMAVVLVKDTTDSVYRKEYCKVAMSSLIAANSFHAVGDESYSDLNPTGVWGEAFHCGSETTYFYHTDQVPDGIFILDSDTPKIYNPYTKDAVNYPSFSLTPTDDYFNPSFSYKNNRLFVWETNTDETPTTLDWECKNYFEYKRLWMYQPFAYLDRRQQFIDAFVAFGYFYEQRNGNIRMLRVDGSGTNYGTFTDSNLLLKKTVEGITDYANQWTVNILGQRIAYGSGTRKKNIKTIMGHYGWLGKMLTDKYMDWYEKLDFDNDGLEIHLDMKEFYSIASTYIPKLGNRFTYDSVNYNIVSVLIDMENWVIKLLGVKDA